MLILDLENEVRNSRDIELEAEYSRNTKCASRNVTYIPYPLMYISILVMGSLEKAIHNKPIK